MFSEYKVIKFISHQQSKRKQYCNLPENTRPCLQRTARNMSSRNGEKKFFLPYRRFIKSFCVHLQTNSTAMKSTWITRQKQYIRHCDIPSDKQIKKSVLWK